MAIRKTLKINKKKFRYSGKMRGGVTLPTSAINPVGVITLPNLNRTPFASRGGAIPAPRPAPIPASKPCAPCPAPPPKHAPTVEIKTSPLFPITVTPALAPGPAPAALPPRFWVTNIMCMYSYNLLIISGISQEAINTIINNIDINQSSPAVELYPSFSNMKTYSFHPSIFGLSSLNLNTLTNNYDTQNKIPVYFDFYTYYKSKAAISRTAIINKDDDILTGRTTGTNNRNFINSLFVLDINNIPHYLSVVFSNLNSGKQFDFVKLFKKKNNYMGPYMTNNLHDTPGSDEKSIWLDFYLNGVRNNDLDLTKLTFTVIPSSLGVPNTAYAKVIDSSGMGGVTGPIVPLAPNPYPAPNPYVAPNPAPA